MADQVPSVELEKELRDLADAARRLAPHIDTRPRRSAVDAGGSQNVVNVMLPQPARGADHLRNALTNLPKLIEDYLRRP